MRKTVLFMAILLSCIIFLGGCKETSKELINREEPINTVVDEEYLKTCESLIGLSDEEVVALVGEGIAEAGYRLINGCPHYLLREYKSTPFGVEGTTTVTLTKDETYQAKYYSEEISIVVNEVYVELENADRDFVTEVFQSFAAILGELDCQYGDLDGKYADAFWVDDKGILYALNMDEKNATVDGKVNLHLFIQRDHGRRDENFGRYDEIF